MYENLMFAMCQAWNTYECGIWSWINDWSKAGSSVSPPENLQVGSDCLSIQCPFFLGREIPHSICGAMGKSSKMVCHVGFSADFPASLWVDVKCPSFRQVVANFFGLRDLKKMLWGIPKSPWLFQYHNGFYIILDGLGIHHLRKPPLY